MKKFLAAGIFAALMSVCTSQARDFRIADSQFYRIDRPRYFAEQMNVGLTDLFMAPISPIVMPFAATTTVVDEDDAAGEEILLFFQGIPSGLMAVPILLTEGTVSLGYGLVTLPAAIPTWFIYDHSQEDYEEGRNLLMPPPIEEE